MRPRRLVRVCYFNTWAGRVEDAAAYAARAASIDVAPLVTDPSDADLRRKARLDVDWYAANARCFSRLEHDELEFLPAWVVGKAGVLDVAQRPRQPGEERWLVTMAHQPQALGDLAGRVFGLLARTGVRHLFYAFDEASRFMPCFNAIAPHLDVLLHDEFPLAEAGRARLRPDCVVRHRSWVANFVPFEAGFDEAPAEQIYFLGSQLGLSEHRRRQIAFLRERFGDRFVASHDHTVPVAARATLGRYKVGFAPEGRKFSTPAMGAAHTDRPFWSGCLGQVPVSEDSSVGGRLEDLHRAGLIVRYAHGDLASLAAACERALAAPVELRRRIYDHFNRRETIGPVVAEALAAAGPVRTASAAAPVPAAEVLGV